MPEPETKREAETPAAPIVRIPVTPAGARRGAIKDEDFVIGVEVGMESRAYPINDLATPERHVLNDRLGGRAVAVSWCGLCNAPLAFSRNVAGKELTLFVTRRLFAENLVMKDVETGSEWSQVRGKAIEGPLKETCLEPLPAIWTDWKTWRTNHPETTVADLTPVTDRFRHAPEFSADRRERSFFSGLQWGLFRNGTALSWPFQELARRPLVHGEHEGVPYLLLFDRWNSTATAFDRRLDGKELTFASNDHGVSDDQTGSVWDPITGRALSGPMAGRRLSPIAGTITTTRAWRIFHPQSEIRIAEEG